MGQAAEKMRRNLNGKTRPRPIGLVVVCCHSSFCVFALSSILDNAKTPMAATDHHIVKSKATLGVRKSSWVPRMYTVIVYEIQSLPVITDRPNTSQSYDCWLSSS